ncbi:UNVERIFIED_ORG: HK97 gp10 family phage protein [Heyndrickxia coagulans]
MGLDIDTTGIDKALKDMGKREKRARNTALKKAGEALADRLRQNTPIDNDDKNKMHLKDDIIVSNVDKYGEIKVGFGHETYWRAHFVELGTIKQRPQHFIEQTEQEMQDKIMEIIQKELMKGLGL